MTRRRHVPQRTCIGCRTAGDKRQLLRIVRTPEGEVVFDPTGKRSGRGAYVCRSEACFEQALKARTLSAALKAEVGEAQVAALREALRRLLAGGDDAGPPAP